MDSVKTSNSVYLLQQTSTTPEDCACPHNLVDFSPTTKAFHSGVGGYNYNAAAAFALEVTLIFSK